MTQKIDYRQTATAKKGRNGDKYMAHIAEGELIVPPVISDELRQAIYAEMQAAGIDPAEFEASGEEIKINPETGKPEFFFKGLKKILSNPIVSAALPFVLGPAGLGLSTLASAGVGAGLGALSGNGLKGIAAGALGAASGGIGNAIGGQIAGSTGLSGALSNALGRGLTSATSTALTGGKLDDALLSGGLSGVGSLYQSGAFNGLGDAFKNNGLSGALSQFDANTPGTGDILKKGNLTGGNVAGGGASSYKDLSNTSYFPSGESVKWNTPTTANVPTGTAATTAKAKPTTPTAPTGKAATGNETSGGDMSGSTTKRGLESILNAGLSTYGNDKAAKELLAKQQEGLAALQPVLNQQFDPSNLASDPGYQFQLKQGLGALDSANAARGNYFSGDALRSAGEYASGLANSTVNDAYNRFSNTRAQDLSGVMQKYGILGDMGTTKAQSTLNKNNDYMQSISNALNPQSSFEELLARYLGKA